MKDSDIPWLSQIPNTWMIRRLKDLGFLYGGLTGKSSDDFNVEEDNIEFMHFIPFTNIFNNLVINPNLLGKVKISEGEQQNLVLKNDLLFLMSSEDYDGVGKPSILETQIDNLGLNSFCKGFRVTDIDTYPKYLLYYLASHLGRETLRQEAKGFIRINLRQDKLACCSILLPPFPEQQAIADFLDKKCSEIDEMISLQEKIIEELKAYKQSVITEAVTKGLNPDVPMKDSGFKWLGDIPSEWEIKPLKYVLSRRNEKNSPVKSKERLSLSIGVGITRYEDKTTNLDRFKDDFTQYQLTYPYDIVLNSMNMIVGAVGMSKFFGCVSPVYYVMSVTQGLSPLYYSYLLNIPTIRGVYHSLGKGIYAIERGEGRVNTCRLKVPFEDFGRIELPVPSEEEQQAIVDYLDKKCSEIDSLIALKQDKIECLQEYKKSIIYEYTTGKKEIDV